LPGLYNHPDRLSWVKVGARYQAQLSLFALIRHDYERDDGGVNQLFTPVFKIDRDAVVDRGLYLTQAPIWLIRMMDKRTGNEQI